MGKKDKFTGPANQKAIAGRHQIGKMLVAFLWSVSYKERPLTKAITM